MCITYPYWIFQHCSLQVRIQLQQSWQCLSRLKLFLVDLDSFLPPLTPVWEYLPRSTFTKDSHNCTDEDFIWDYMGNWWFALTGKYGATIEKDVLTHQCFKYIQSIFGGHLKEIIAIMAYSLNDNGVRNVQREDVKLLQHVILFQESYI